VADLQFVTPSYFNTLGIRLVRGRLLNESDTLNSPMAIMVNEAFLHRYMPNADPLTQHLMIAIPTAGNGSGPHAEPAQAVAYQVVGVFHDVANDEHLTGSIQPQMYVSLWQKGWPAFVFAVRTNVDPATVTDELRSTVAATAPSVQVDNLAMMRDLVNEQQINDRFGMVLFGGFAGVALLLAAVGIYGVMSFAVAQRTHEIGVRMALGARRSEVVMLMIRGGMRLALIGIAIGLAGAFGLGLLMHTTLYGVAATDFGSLAAVAALLFVAAMVACWLPARRSAAIDPMRALRNE
jgi:putative ABC transport system permease protein